MKSWALWLGLGSVCLTGSLVWARNESRVHTQSKAGGVEDTTPYTVVTSVPNAGRVEGTIRFSGTVPTLPSLLVSTTHNPANRACGESIANNALMVDGAQHTVRNVVVSLADISRGMAPAATTLEVDQQHCTFDPHVVAVTSGSSIRFANHDVGMLHNVHGYYSLSGDDTLFNIGTAPGLSVTRRMDRGGIHRVVCDVGHTWMLLYLHVYKHPYFAVTQADGRFSIANIPPGQYRLRFWHEGWSITGTDARSRPIWSPAFESDQSITITPRGRLRVDASLSANGFSITPPRR